MPKIAIIVPCRLESTRFPRKLLHKIKGRPLLLWVAAGMTAYFLVNAWLLLAL